MTDEQASKIALWGRRLRQRGLVLVLVCLVLQYVGQCSLPDAGPNKSSSYYSRQRIEFAMAMHDGRLESIKSGIWGDELPREPYLVYRAKVSGERVNASPPFFAWRWGEANMEFRALHKQHLFWGPSLSEGDGVKQDRNDNGFASDDLIAQVERVVGDVLDVSQIKPSDCGFGSMYDTFLPIRVVAGAKGDEIHRPEYSVKISSWRLWLTSGITAISLVCGFVGIVYLVRWMRLHDLRAKRVGLGFCGDCGYDLRDLPKCPECGGQNRALLNNRSIDRSERRNDA